MMSTENSASGKGLVSIICRTIGRPELQQALQSVNSQGYPNIEIILIDAAAINLGDSAEQLDNIPTTLISTGQALGRSAAANAGLQAAKGRYLMFLDDDDWIADDHVESLVEFLQGQEGIRAAYSSTQKTAADGSPVDYVFQEDFDPILLMRDNYIPIHAMLFEKSLLEHGCKFDEAFDIYEDWDFWLQLSQHTEFRHIENISAFYREGGDSETAVENVQLRYLSDNALGKGRAAIFDKWLTHWNGEKFNRLVGQLDQSPLLRELSQQLHQAHEDNTDLQHKLNGSSMYAEQLTQQLHEKDSQIIALQQHSQEQATQSAAQHEQLEAQTKQLEAQTKQLEAQTKQLEAQTKQLEAQARQLVDQTKQLETQAKQVEVQAKQVEVQAGQLATQDEQLRDQANQLIALARHSETQAKHISELESVQNAIYSSASWKFMGPFRRIARLFRPASKAAADKAEPDL